MDGLLVQPMDGAAVEQVLREVEELRREVSQLRDQVARLQSENLVLRQEAGYWKSRFEGLRAKVQSLEAEKQLLQAQKRQLQDQHFARQSEKQHPDRRGNSLDDPDDPRQASRRRGQQAERPGPRRRDHSHLPSREQTIDLPEAEQCCPQCGKPRHRLGATEDSEQIEIEILIFRRVIRRQRYRATCDCGQRTYTAAAPAKLIPKSRLGLSVWLEILLEKFAYHRPIARLLERWRESGLDLAAGSVADGLHRLTPLFEPIYEALLQRNAQSAYAQADETRWLVFIEQEGKVGHRWWLWVFIGDDTVVYRLDPSRSHAVPEGHYAADAKLVIMVDRYSAYKAMAQVKNGSIVLAFCWAHQRRDFIRVGKGYAEFKRWALDWLKRIRELYRLNDERCAATAADRRSEADARLRAAVAQMRAQAQHELANPSLRLPCRQVLESLLNHWDGLTRFVDDPRIPMDNNRSERQARGPALGRKNYYGSGAAWSGRLAAMLFSIFATLRHWHLSPRLWLQAYLEACAVNQGRAPPDIGTFLPWNLSAEQRQRLTDPT